MYLTFVMEVSRRLKNAVFSKVSQEKKCVLNFCNGDLAVSPPNGRSVLKRQKEKKRVLDFCNGVSKIRSDGTSVKVAGREGVRDR